jgi:crossover junction endodeoxyribonuclease RuvC
MKALGVDPGLRVSGYAVVTQADRALRVLDAGVIRVDVALPLPRRLEELYREAAALLAEHQPDVLAVEELYAHYKHPATAILLGHARGVFLLAAGQAGVPVLGFSATRVKKSLTGNGRATKQQMQRAIATQLGLARPPHPADVADALAIGLCCLNETRRDLTRGTHQGIC